MKRLARLPACYIYLLQSHNRTPSKRYWLSYVAFFCAPSTTSTQHLSPDSDPDFVDEAVWEALYAGVIPVYYGAANIKDHVPPNSIISAADYGQKAAAAEHIH
jgi:hypothetical protein